MPTTYVLPVAARTDGPPASRDLDALVAEKVFGWKRYRFAAGGPRGDENKYWLNHPDDKQLDGTGVVEADANDEPYLDWVRYVPNYSTYVAEGWRVLEWMSEHGHRPEVGFAGGVDYDHQDGVRVTYYDHANYMRTGSGWTAAWGETMPLAACRAALAAVESRQLWSEKEV